MSVFFRNCRIPCEMYLGVGIPKTPVTDKDLPLTFTALQANSTISLQKMSINETELSSGEIDPYEVSAEISYDNGNTFQTWDGSNITLQNIGDTVQLRTAVDNHLPWNKSNSNATVATNFKTTGKLDVNGNIGSLFFKNFIDHPNNNNLTQGSFSLLFAGNESLNSVKHLYFPELWKYSSYNFQFMFMNCSNLLEAPQKIPSMLGYYACQQMFHNCYSLIDTPEIIFNYIDSFNSFGVFYGCFANCKSLASIIRPIVMNTIIYGSQCHSMFLNCNNLKDVSKLSFNINNTNNFGQSACNSMFKNCYSLSSIQSIPQSSKLNKLSFCSMFEGCSSLIYVPDIPGLSNTIDVTGCYQYMFKGCTSLINAPQFSSPMFSMRDNICYSMFQDCTSLVSPPSALNALSCNSNSYNAMFKNCISLTSAPIISALSVNEGTCFEMFYGCSSLLSVQEILPAIKLGKSCYRSMFDRCTSLRNAPQLPATELSQDCYRSMFYNCSSLQSECINLPAENLVQDCYRYMMFGCSKISSINVGFSSWNPSGTNSWVQNVSSNGLFKCPTALTVNRGNNAIPNNWIIERNDV